MIHSMHINDWGKIYSMHILMGDLLGAQYANNIAIILINLVDTEPI